jgi:hypothetical protein
VSLPAVIFPDVEKILVAEIKQKLNQRDETYTNAVTVSTKKPGPDVKPYPKKSVVIRSDGGPEIDHVRKLERIGVSVYASTYADASDLARMVQALMRTTTGRDIKQVTAVLSPVRVDEEGPQEARYMTFEIITKAKTL